MDDSIGSIALFWLILCFICSAFFSGAETAFFSLSKIHLKRLEKENTSINRRIFRLLGRSRQLLITILLGNTLVNIAAASIATELTLQFGRVMQFSDQMTNLLLVGQVALMTILLLVFGEITPKLVAFATAEKYAKYGAILLEGIWFILYPLVKILEWISMAFTRQKQEEDQGQITSEDLRSLIRFRTTKHPLEDTEKKMIAGIIDLPSTKASEIMVPRVDIVAVNIAHETAQIRKVIKESGHSRIPVYRKSIDNIIGFIYAKDLILKEDVSRVEKLIRKPIFVPENMTIQNLLNQFRQSKVHMAIVVDEYGGTSGLITLEDILEEMFGEIMDEHDNEADRVVKVSDTVYKVSGMCSISELNEMFDLGIDEEEYDNLAGFMFDKLNHVPCQNEAFTLNDWVVFTVIELNNNRIDSVQLEFLESENDGED